MHTIATMPPKTQSSAIEANYFEIHGTPKPNNCSETHHNRLNYDEKYDHLKLCLYTHRIIVISMREIAKTTRSS